MVLLSSLFTFLVFFSSVRYFSGANYAYTKCSRKNDVIFCIHVLHLVNSGPCCTCGSGFRPIMLPFGFPGKPVSPLRRIPEPGTRGADSAVGFVCVCTINDEK